jgi:starch phosphorylase
MDKSLYSLMSAEVEGVEALAELALDLHWSWSHSTDEMWKRLDPELWELTHNPWVTLQTVSRDKLQGLLADPVFQRQVDEFLCAKRDRAGSPAWFQQGRPQSPLTCVAYFSMEFMLSEALPVYSGGLGNVAGDQLKAASDLGVPVVGVGLLYQQGYFRQVIDATGAQQALYPYNDPGQLPITPLREPNGEWLRLKIAFPGCSLWLRAWQAQVGRVKLYLLDSNDPANLPIHRGITSELYGGGPELRLKQEIVLGLGGWRLLRARGIQPEVCHLNEGHAALAVLERARSFMEDARQPFDVALTVTRAGNVFTTHTPVAAGLDRFPPALVEQYLGEYARHDLGISFEELLALGRRNPNDPGEQFNMALLAIRGVGAINGVSRLHGEVSRKLFQPLFPRWPETEVPIGHVTNGVHMPTWDSAEADELWTCACGKSRWLGEMETLEEDIRSLSDSRLWRLRTDARKSLIDFTRKRLALQLAASGASPEEVAQARHIFNYNALTLGFARRFATYKRPNLLLRDPERLLRILADPQRPAQLIIAGKAHPADEAGKEMIKAWTNFARRPEARAHVIFLSDYDMLLTERLVQGVDVWINTPRRPLEACGTSGMKALVNGGLNLSELDGWWAEAYSPEVGWAVFGGRDRDDDAIIDAVEAEELYAILEQKIIPEFYIRDEIGIPTSWVGRIRESMAQLTPRFSANRAVREYTERYYLPAARAWRERAAKDGEQGAQIVEWRRALARHLQSAHFGNLQVETAGHEHLFQIQVYLNELDAEMVRVELYADAPDGGSPTRQEMARTGELVGAANGYIYSARAPASRPASDYTPRLVPYHRHAAVPLEASHILWQR